MSDGGPTIGADDERRLAAELFNRVWSLLERDERTQADDDEMLHAAHASAFHWRRAGEHVHAARGEWQCSRVYAVLGRAEPALHHARRCLALCEAGPVEDFDLPFAHEALARAHAQAGDLAQAAAHVALARELAAAIADDEDRETVLADLRTVPAPDAGGGGAPSPAEVRAVLAGLAGGGVTPEAAARWASGWAAADATGGVDDAVAEALDQLRRADATVDGEALLHLPEDFADWLEDFDAAVGRSDAGG